MNEPHGERRSADCSEVRFDGRVAVVTGAGRGIGRDVALLLGRKGAAVVVNDVGVSADAARYEGHDHASGSGAAERVAEEIRRAGGTALASRADVTDRQQVDSMVEDARRTLGRIDIVINNAGIVLTAAFGELTSQMLSRCLDVHIGGSFNVAQAAWPHMSGQGFGRILNVCSTSGVLVGNAEHAAYAAAKAGLAGLTRAMAKDGEPLGILVNGLLPGARTRGHDSVDPGLSPTHDVDMSPSLVAPGLCWLVHEACEETGSFYACSSARMGAVFAAVGAGCQSSPAAFSLELVRDSWPSIKSREPSFVPDDIEAYNDFRVASYFRENPPTQGS